MFDFKIQLFLSTNKHNYMVSKSIFQGQALSMSKSVLGISSCHHWGTYHIAPSAIKVYKFRSITVSKFHGKVQFTSHVTGFTVSLGKVVVNDDTVLV